MVIYIPSQWFTYQSVEINQQTLNGHSTLAEIGGVEHV